MKERPDYLSLFIQTVPQYIINTTSLSVKISFRDLGLGFHRSNLVFQQTWGKSTSTFICFFFFFFFSGVEIHG